jgi:hypothetical protein
VRPHGAPSASLSPHTFKSSGHVPSRWIESGAVPSRNVLLPSWNEQNAAADRLSRGRSTPLAVPLRALSSSGGILGSNAADVNVVRVNLSSARTSPALAECSQAIPRRRRA